MAVLIDNRQKTHPVKVKQIKRAEDVGIEQELWGLYTDYRDLFSLEEPFRAEEHLVATNSEEHTWTGLNLACVESHARFDLRSMSMKVRRLRETPPQINVNLNNMTFPQVALPNLPPGITPDQFNAMVQQTVRATVQQALNASVQNAIKQLIQSLPQKGFQKIVFDSKWETEA